jgi:hypothetical protein
LYILPFILHICNLYHKPSRHTVSKAFSKSINAQKSFFFDLQIYVKLFTILYADDTVLLAESAEELQSELN